MILETENLILKTKYKSKDSLGFSDRIRSKKSPKTLRY